MTEIMLPDFGKLLFPQLQRGQRRREIRNLFAALVVGLVLAGAIAGVMIFTGKTGGR